MSGSTHSEPDLRPLAYELPRAPRIAVEGWLARLQAVALITALLAGVQAQLLGNLPDTGHKASDKAIRIFAYAGLCANIGSTLSAVLLLLAITTVPTSARHLYVSCSHSYPRRLFSTNTTQPPDETDVDAQKLLLNAQAEAQLLRAFGVARGFELMTQHCLITFLAGVICTFLQVGMAAWLQEGNAIGIVVLFAVMGCLLPPIYVFCFLMSPHRCDECHKERLARRNNDHEMHGMNNVNM
ncbi:hypothetical protein BKA62DRAFT_707760 [Auriculariales sp. MPI-PUGE-AT-0066]|nr:hypothetical protein BKA62DRAFT_707760 [Auriculariales sp. MPI-PUGE-AT-0066]